MKNNIKIIVIGLDGAGFELINPWLKQNLLPNINKLIKNGVKGDLKVCLPPVTCPNWKCYSTGKNPGKLGLFWWRQISIEDKTEFTAYKRFNNEKEIWDYLSDDGKKVAVINMPTTYPPKKVNGIFVSGGAGILGEDFTYPKKLKKYLVNKYGYRIGATKVSILSHSSEEIFQDCLDVIDRKFYFFKDLLKENYYDFLNLSIFHINTFHHLFWNSEPTKKAWIRIDKHIGDIMKILKQKKDRYCIFLMSDHGSNKIKEVFNINAWLQKEGYLKIKQKLLFNLMQFLKVDLRKLLNISSKVGVSKQFLLKLFPKYTLEKLITKLPIEYGEIKSKKDVVDWDNSIAIAEGQGPIYININKSSKNYENIKKELKEKIIKLKTPLNNSVANTIYAGADIYTGPYLKEAPDLIIDQAKGIHINGNIKLKGDIFEKPTHWKGENKRLGLFVAHGFGIKKNKTIKNIRIIDLAPTILWLFNIKTPHDVDGKVCLSIFNKNIKKWEK